MAASNVDWVTITQGATGSGSLPVRFMVAPNAGAFRSATLTIASQAYRIEQAGAGGSCSPVPILSNQPVTYALSSNDCRARFQPNFSGGENPPARLYQFTASAGQRECELIAPAEL